MNSPTLSKEAVFKLKNGLFKEYTSHVIDKLLLTE